MNKKNVLIIGARGFKRNYGGWETLVQNLIYNWKDETTQFHIWEVVHDKSEEGILKYGDVVCPQLYTKKWGHATMPIFCVKAVFHALRYIKENKLENVILYMLGGRIGPLFWILRPIFKSKNIKVIVNPDGLEWKRDKWNWFEKQYWKFAEATMLRSCDHIISDSKGISKYIKDRYPKLKKPISYIAYGAYKIESKAPSEEIFQYMKKFQIKENEYYLVVGRFIPENNYELIIKEFMKSKTNKKLLLICNLEKNKFYDYLRENTEFEYDYRIIMAGPLYKKEILEYIRTNAFAYIHGHSAGGTNPSLLEALTATKVNILYDVIFNREVGGDATYYFSESNALSAIIDECDTMSIDKRNEMGEKAKKIIENNYTWDIVVERHKELFDSLV